MSISNFSRPARRFLLNRLERLRESLEALGHRLRQCVSDIIGTQVGEAIRDALDRTLRLKSLVPTPTCDPPEIPPGVQQEDPRGWDWEPPDPEEAYREPDAPGWEPSPEPSPPPRAQQAPTPPSDVRPSRWRSVLAGLVELAGWWLQRGPKRSSLRKLFGLGAIVGTLMVVAGPVVGGVAMTVSTALLLTSSANAQSAPATVTSH
jgi:hypothetical protein